MFFVELFYIVKRSKGDSGVISNSKGKLNVWFVRLNSDCGWVLFCTVLSADYLFSSCSFSVLRNCLQFGIELKWGQAISTLGGSEIFFEGIWRSSCPFLREQGGSLDLQQWLLSEAQFSWGGTDLSAAHSAKLWSLGCHAEWKGSSNHVLRDRMCKYCPRFVNWQMTQRCLYGGLEVLLGLQLAFCSR